MFFSFNNLKTCLPKGSLLLLFYGMVFMPALTGISTRASKNPTEREWALVTIAEANAQCLTETGKKDQKEAFELADKFLKTKDVSIETIDTIKNDENFHGTKDEYIQYQGGCRNLVLGITNPEKYKKPTTQTHRCPPGKRQYQKTALFGLIKGQKLCLSDYEAESLRAQRQRDIQNNIRDMQDNIQRNQPRIINCTSSRYGSYMSTTCF